MNKLKKCKICKSYTLKESHCNAKTEEAGYKYIKTKSDSLVKTTSSEPL